MREITRKLFWPFIFVLGFAAAAAALSDQPYSESKASETRDRVPTVLGEMQSASPTKAPHWRYRCYMSNGDTFDGEWYGRLTCSRYAENRIILRLYGNRSPQVEVRWSICENVVVLESP